MKHIFRRFSLTMSLVLFVFFVLIITGTIVGSLFILFVKMNWIQQLPRYGSQKNILVPFFFLFFLSVVMGTTLTALFSRKIMRPYKKALDGLDQVASGDFDVKLHFEHAGYELTRLSQSFNQMTSELNGIETLRSDFINHFSHEFKTPIVSIQGFAKLLKNPALTEEERQKYIDIIIQESGRLTKLSSNILNLTNIENRGILTETTSIQLDEQLRQVLLILEPKWQEKNLTLDLDLPPTQIISDEELLQQLWINLIENAIKFSPPGSKLFIQITTLAKKIKITIQDFGIGMSQQTLSHLFDKFYQGETSHSKEGNGLGMPLVKKIVDLCEGELTIDSSLGKGTTVSVELKIVETLMK